MKIPFYPLVVIVFLFSEAVGQMPRVDSLVTELGKAREDTNKVILYRMLTGLVLNTDPAKAIGYGKAGVQLGKQLRFDKGVAGCYLNLSAAFSSHAQLDSSVVYIDSAISWSRKVGEPARLALAFLNRADIHMQLRQLKQSLVDCDTALRYAELANNNDRRARILQTMGSVYFVQDKFAESRAYYERADRLYREAGNKRMMAIIANNIGNVHKNTQAYTTAIDQFNSAIALAQDIGDEVNLSMYYGNLSDTYTKMGQYAEAEKQALQSLEHAKTKQIETQTGIALTYLGQIYLKQKKFQQSIQSAADALDIMERNQLLEEQHTAADILAEAYALAGNHTQAYTYLQKSKLLGDSLARQKYDEEIAGLQTAFKLEEKNNEIVLLNKDKQIKDQQLSRQRILLGASLVVLAFAVTGVFLVRRQHRLRQRMKEMELRNNIAADLHDEVGSSLSSIYMLSEMASLGTQASDPQKDLLHKVTSYSRETMDKMSDIVWMIKPAGEDGRDLQERMQHFLYGMCNAMNINHHFEGGGLLHLKSGMQQKKAVYLIFKEAVNNALKYADPQNIRVTITRDHHFIEMAIADDGKGFEVENARRGNGLGNMQGRAKELGGQLVILSEPGKGTQVICRIPG